MKCNCSGCCKNCKEIDATTKLLKAISEPNRVRILCLLIDGAKYSGEISDKLDIPHNLVSFHLGILLEEGFLKKKKEGNKTYYSIKDSKIEKIKKFLDLSK